MINYDNLPEFPGFTVYDRETGEPITDVNLPIEEEIHYSDWLPLGQKVFIAVPYPESGSVPNEILTIPRDSTHIIQIGTEMYKW